MLEIDFQTLFILRIQCGAFGRANGLSIDRTNRSSAAFVFLSVVRLGSKSWMFESVRLWNGFVIRSVLQFGTTSIEAVLNFGIYRSLESRMSGYIQQKMLHQSVNLRLLISYADRRYLMKGNGNSDLSAN